MADTKISALTADSSPTSDDLIVTVNDPLGTPANRKVTMADLLNTVNKTAAYGSLPAAGWTGRLLLPSDGFGLIRDNGTDKNTLWGPCFPLTDPAAQSFAWINQGSATVTTTNGGVYIFCPAPGSSGDNVALRKKAAPATPYTITAFILPLLKLASYPQARLFFRESSSGKLVGFGLYSNNSSTGVGPLPSLSMAVTKFTNPTTFSADYTAPYMNLVGPACFLRIADNGTNRICSYSNDGINFMPFHSVGRTDFLTADEVGFGVNTNGNCDTGMSVLSWVQG